MLSRRFWRLVRSLVFLLLRFVRTIKRSLSDNKREIFWLGLFGMSSQYQNFQASSWYTCSHLNPLAEYLGTTSLSPIAATLSRHTYRLLPFRRKKMTNPIGVTATLTLSPANRSFKVLISQVWVAFQLSAAFLTTNGRLRET